MGTEQLNPIGGSQGNFEIHTPYLSKLSGQFIKDVINRGGGGFAKRWSYLISLFSKIDDEGGREGGQKSQKNDDVFNEWPLN